MESAPAHASCSCATGAHAGRAHAEVGTAGMDGRSEPQVGAGGPADGGGSAGELPAPMVRAGLRDALLEADDAPARRGSAATWRSIAAGRGVQHAWPDGHAKYKDAHARATTQTPVGSGRSTPSGSPAPAAYRGRKGSAGSSSTEGRGPPMRAYPWARPSTIHAHVETRAHPRSRGRGDSISSIGSELAGPVTQSGATEGAAAMGDATPLRATSRRRRQSRTHSDTSAPIGACTAARVMQPPSAADSVTPQAHTPPQSARSRRTARPHGFTPAEVADLFPLLFLDRAHHRIAIPSIPPTPHHLAVSADAAAKVEPSSVAATVKPEPDAEPMPPVAAALLRSLSAASDHAHTPPPLSVPPPLLPLPVATSPGIDPPLPPPMPLLRGLSRQRSTDSAQSRVAAAHAAASIVHKIFRHYTISTPIADDLRFEHALLQGPPYDRPVVVHTTFKPCVRAEAMDRLRRGLLPDARAVLEEPNAGGNSEKSEAISVEILHACQHAQLWASEMGIRYERSCSIIDYIATLRVPETVARRAGHAPDHDWSVGTRAFAVEHARSGMVPITHHDMVIGVSVTRAMKYAGGPAAFTIEDGVRLLTKKLSGLLSAREGVSEAHGWSRQILHIWAEADRIVDVLEACLPLLDPHLWRFTIILCTVAPASTMHRIIFKNAEFVEPVRFDPRRHERAVATLHHADRMRLAALDGHVIRKAEFPDLVADVKARLVPLGPGP